MLHSPSRAPYLPLSRSAESGTAFVITLLSMVVLGIILLSLSVITQTERQIATNDLMSNRVFYAADTGLNLGVARVLTVGSSVGTGTPANPEQMTFFIPEAPILGQNRGQEVIVSPFFPLRVFYCDGCNADLLDDAWFKVNHAVSSTARRTIWTGAPGLPPANSPTLASKQTYFQVGMEPWAQPPIDSINPANDYSMISQDTRGVAP